MQVGNVFTKLFEYMTVQWYFEKSDPDPRAIWFPQSYLLDFNALVASGKAGPPDPTVYLRKILAYFLSYYTTQSDDASNALVTALETINGLPNLQDYIVWPEITKLNEDSVTVTLPYSIDPACADLTKVFLTQTNLETAMQRFYKDDAGIYAISGTNNPMNNPTIVRINASPQPITKSFVENNKPKTFTVGYTYDVEVKMSFMMMLRYYVLNQNAFQGTSLAIFQKFSQPGIPIPVCIDQTKCMQDMGCTDKDSHCNCLYYCAFGTYECPGYAYYYCQFYDRCKCVLSRAVPIGTDLKDRIMNKFGLCFDINCSDYPDLHPTDCSDQCTLAKEWLTTPNWSDDFLNPAAVNVDLIEKTCNMDVPQFSVETNAYFWTWEIIGGCICMLLTVPMLVAMESWGKEKFSLRFIHILAFLLLVGMAIVFGYALVGVQVCGTYGLPNQAVCLDRLTQSVKMNHKDCDAQNPIFCQCDASVDNLKPCSAIEMPNCKCQNNQLCLPGGGDDDVVEPAPATQKLVRWQLLYFCLGLYMLVSTSLGVGLYYLVNKKGSVGWLPTVSLGVNVVLHLVVYLVLFALIVIFPVAWMYVKDLDQTMHVNVAKQGKLCSAV